MRRELAPLAMLVRRRCWRLRAAWLAPQWLVFLVTARARQGRGRPRPPAADAHRARLVRPGPLLRPRRLRRRAAVGALGRPARRGPDAAGRHRCRRRVAALLGLLLARYRDIFFAMLSLAFSMILYGLLVKSSALGSTDGFNLHGQHLRRAALAAGVRAARLPRRRRGRCRWSPRSLLHRLLASHWGRVSAAIARQRAARRLSRRLGLSASSTSTTSSPARWPGSAARSPRSRSAMSIRKSPTGPPRASSCSSPSSAAPAACWRRSSRPRIFEALRTVASQYAPNVWQMSLGLAMLAIIMFLPAACGRSSRGAGARHERHPGRARGCTRISAP